MARLMRLAASIPYRSAYERDHPTILLMAPTHRILRNATVPVLERVAGAAIIRKRGPPHSDFLLANGSRIVCFSAESELTGATVAALVCDEIHHPAYWVGGAWAELINRVRDPLAPWLATIGMGYAAHSLREHFEDSWPHPLPAAQTKILAAFDNPALGDAARDQIAAVTAWDHRDALTRPMWLPQPSAAFPFDPEVHVSPRAAYEQRKGPVHLGIDVGEKSSAAVAAQIDRGELHIFREWYTGTDDITGLADRIWIDLSAVGQQPGRGSLICHDPTARGLEKEVLRRRFAPAEIRTQNRDGDYYHVVDGEAHLRTLFRAADGRVRLLLAPQPREKRQQWSLEVTLSEYQSRRGNGGHRSSHLADALRYLAVNALPGREPAKIEVVPVVKVGGGRWR